MTADVHTPLSRWQVLLMAFATGVAVASNYYAQPLLHTIAGEFGVSFGRAGTLVTAAQLLHVSNQNVVFALRPEARNRLNAGYMTGYFIGGSLGSLVSAQVYGAFGWTGVCVTGAGVAAVAMAVWAMAALRR